MTTLRVLLRNYQDFESALQDEARRFEAEHPGVHLELVPVGIHELYDAAFRDGGLRLGHFDLALLVTDWLAEGIASGALEDLNPWQHRAPIPDWPAGWASSLVRPLVFDQHLSSLPWHDGPECLVYRKDLFADEQLRTAHRSALGRELAPPSTWHQFAETAQFLTGARPGLYGTAFAAFPDGHNTLYDFALQVWSRGGELIDAKGAPRVDSDQAVRALDFYRRVVLDAAVCHPASLRLDSTQSGDIFLAGEVAMMVNWFGFAARSDREGSPLAQRVAIAPIPADPGCAPVSLSVFWSLAIAAGSKQKDLAWEFLRFVASAENDLAMTKHGTVGVRLSTWRNTDLQSRIPAYREIETISLGARNLPTGPQMADFAATVDSIMTRALTTDAPSAAILREAQHAIEKKGIRFP